MYCSRPVARSPSAIRVVRPGRCGGQRNASFLAHHHPFYSRFGAPAAYNAGDNFVAPFFRIFDEFAAATRNSAATSFQPRFDIREVGETYEVSGELPGIEGKDIEVEFADPQTLVVRGRTERESSSGTPPAAVEASADATETTNAVAEAPADNSDAASTYSTGSYQKPSVEEEDAPGQATPAESAADNAEKADTPATVQEEKTQPTSHYWVSERSTGAFQRVFKFPNRIDQEAVKASLKNGILNITVPKAPEPAAKKITVE